MKILKSSWISEKCASKCLLKTTTLTQKCFFCPWKIATNLRNLKFSNIFFKTNHKYFDEILLNVKVSAVQMLEVHLEKPGKNTQKITVQKCAKFVCPKMYCKMSIYLKKSSSVQPRMSIRKFLSQKGRETAGGARRGRARRGRRCRQVPLAPASPDENHRFINRSEKKKVLAK